MQWGQLSWCPAGGGPEGSGSGFSSAASHSCLRASSLPHAGGTNTTIVSVTRVPHGWEVVTSTVYLDDQQVQAQGLC